MSQKVKNELLSKKKKRDQKESYLTAQQVVKNYREKQKSHAGYKRKEYVNNKEKTAYDVSKEGAPVAVVRICG